MRNPVIPAATASPRPAVLPAGPAPIPLAPGRASAGWVRALPQVLLELGLDAERLLAQCGIDPAILDDEKGALAFRALGELFGRAVRESGCPHVALLVGERFDPSDLAELSMLTIESPTVDAALRALILQFHLMDEGAVPILLPSSAGRVMLAHSIYERDVPALDQFADLAMSIAVRVLKELCGSAFQPLRVSLPHRPTADAAPYRRILGAPVTFNARIAGVAFSAAWLEQPVFGGKAPVRAPAHARPDVEPLAPTMPLAHRLRRALRPMVFTGTATESAAARLFSMHPRALRRALHAEGESFLALLNETRMAIARQLLRDTDIGVAEIAATLHYSDATAFTRAFRLQTRESPMIWRRREHEAGR